MTESEGGLELESASSVGSRPEGFSSGDTNPLSSGLVIFQEELEAWHLYVAFPIFE